MNCRRCQNLKRENYRLQLELDALRKQDHNQNPKNDQPPIPLPPPMQIYTPPRLGFIQSTWDNMPARDV